MRLKVIIGVLFVFALVGGVLAVPAQIQNCDYDGCLLTIPRYKMFQSWNNPDNLWIIYDSYAGGNFRASTNGGATWGTPLDAHSNMNYHASIAGDASDNVYITDRIDTSSVFFRKVNAPGTSSGDFDPGITISTPYSGSTQTPNILVENENSVFVILRASANAAGNIYYVHSTDGGQTFGSPQLLYASGSPDVRIGSFLLNGVPAVVLHYYSTVGSPNLDYQYFVWDGSTFVANPDFTAAQGFGTGQDRHFSMNYANGEVHLVFSDRHELVHNWKSYNNGVGTWNTQVVDTNARTGYLAEWTPSLSAHGNDLYLFYSRLPGTDTAVSDVLYRKWDKTTQSWGPRVYLMTGGSYAFPQAPMVVNPSSTFIPVMWEQRGNSIWYDTIPVSVGPDTTPAVLSNGQPSGTLASGTTSIQLSVTTNEAATCRYGTTPGVVYASIANTFATTGGTSHTSSSIGVSDGSSYSYYVRCNDTAGNIDETDYMISFSVASAGGAGGSTDVNSDGNVNVIDLVLVTFWQSKADTDGDWAEYSHLDVNSDGRVNWSDVATILFG